MMNSPDMIVLFDIDGTLLSSSGAGLRALERAMADLHGITESMRGISLAGRTDRSIVRDLVKAHGLPAGSATEDAILESYLGHLPEQLTAAAKLLPGITPLLDHLANRADVSVGLLTGNIRRGARAKLGHFDIFHHFQFGGFGDHHTDRDDVAREAISELRQRHGEAYPADRVLVIGDTPLDIRCARAVGARVLAVATGIHTVEELAPHAPDHLMADLADTREVVALLA